MTHNRFRIARDYNRGLAPPVRAAHLAWAPFGPAFASARAWLDDPARRWWTRPAVWGVIAFTILFPLDGPIMRAARALPLGGDIAQELASWQQYGALGSLVFTGLLIRLLDPARSRRILDLAAAAGSAALLGQLLKIAIGRPRPSFAPFDPHAVLGPFGAYPLGPAIGVRHAWELWQPISSKLWSMPSSHTAAAAALSVFLVAVYPRIRPVAIAMVVLVGGARVLFNDHWPSDVAVGATIGVIAARAALRFQWGPRLAALVWTRPLSTRAASETQRTELPASSPDKPRGATPVSTPGVPDPLTPSPAAPHPLHSAP